MAPPAIAALRGPRPTWSPKDTVSSIDNNDSRRQLAAGSWDGFVRLYDLNSLKCLTNPGMLGHTDKVTAVKYSADKSVLVSAGALALLVPKYFLY